MSQYAYWYIDVDPVPVVPPNPTQPNIQNVSQPPPTLSSLLIYNPYHPHGLIPSNGFCQGSPNHHHPGSFFEQRLFMGNWLNSEPIFLCHDKD